ncbi:MAG: DUF389 domain-containing protein, partial [Desulfobacterales bacterium]|nr:DUF389 domain-containing protein [Desulfobacterales bacterium]
MKATVSQSIKTFLSTSAQRKKTVLDDITQGAQPQANYFVMLSLSVLISAFGLLTNSPAVIIGAMLISPLMTPIFGISLGLARGNVTLLRHGMVGLFSGVALAIGVSMLLGLLPFPWEVTPEILMRTRPTLLDLGVAVFAGTAGCIAMIDERLSPVLPGIAIATSLAPPLAASGLCIALGAYAGAWGAFLLFFANFLAILFISAVLFVVAGFVTRAEMGSGRELARRFAVAVFSLLVVVVLLTDTLVTVFREMSASEKIERVLNEELAKKPSTSMFRYQFKFNELDNVLDVLAIVKTPKALTPRRVKKIQERLAKAVDHKTNLIISCGLVKDVSARGSSSAVVSTDLDGRFITSQLPPKIRRFQLAEQALREILEEHPGLSLLDFDLVDLNTGPVLLATIRGASTLKPDMVADFEQLVQSRMVDYQVRLLVRSEKVTGVTSKGRVLRGNAHFNNYSTRELEEQFLLEETATTELNRIVDLTVVAADAIQAESRWEVLVEAIGPRPPTPRQVAAAQKRLAPLVNQPVALDVRFRAE